MHDSHTGHNAMHANGTEMTWSEYVAMHGEVTEDTIVHVSAGTTLIFDTASSGTPINIGGMVIEGAVVFEDHASANYDISTDFILAAHGGKFEIGSAQDMFEGEITISLTADEGQPFDITSDHLAVHSTGEPMANPQMFEKMIGNKNNNFVMAMGEGSAINVFVDDAEKSAWAKLDAAVSGGEGENTITVDNEQTGWEVGDVIAITSSYYDLNESEQFTIVAIDGDTITLDGAIEFDHIGDTQTYENQNGEKTADFRANVMLLSRDVTFQGDVDYDPGKKINEQTDTFGGHIMVMNGADLPSSPSLNSWASWIGWAGIRCTRMSWAMKAALWSRTTRSTTPFRTVSPSTPQTTRRSTTIRFSK
ncbi:MAG: G8 domain-containing protein [Pseudomonadota bacterium]